jgi:hypothetical protein
MKEQEACLYLGISFNRCWNEKYSKVVKSEMFLLGRVVPKPVLNPYSIVSH